MMAGQNKCKEKVPDVSGPSQNVETTCNPKLKFIKIYSSKECIKTCHTVANTAVLNIRILSRRYHFRLKVFTSTGE